MTAEEFKRITGNKEENENKLISLYDEYYHKVARYAFVRIGDKNEAEDIASEVFLRALDSLKTYQERGLPMQAWLFKIAHNLVVDHFRKKHKTVSLRDVEIKDDTDPVATAEINIEMIRVNQAMQSLTEEQREVVRLRFFGGLTSREVGEVLNKGDGAVREMQSAALEKLRHLLSETRIPDKKNG
jgi:RNA polymerase sigma-70 factor, ECF subfamily